MNEAYQQQHTRWFLREWRGHFGLTGEELADIMGTTKGNISKLERKRSFKTQWIDRYCSALSSVAKRTITARDLSRHPDSPMVDDLLENAPPDEQRTAREILRAFLSKARDR